VDPCPGCGTTRCTYCVTTNDGDSCDSICGPCVCAIVNASSWTYFPSSLEQSNSFSEPHFEQSVNPNTALTFPIESTYDPHINNYLRDPLDDSSFSSPCTLFHQPQQSFQRFTTSEANLSDSITSSDGDLLSFLAPDNTPPADNNLRGSRSSSVDCSLALSSADGISCTWPSCNKTFPSMHVYKYIVFAHSSIYHTDKFSHHVKNHAKPFQCALCPARHATKRHRDRHINDRHQNTERYYCSVPSCTHSIASGEKAFRRIENCRRHMMRVHKFTADQAKLCDMDAETKRIRSERKIASRVRD
jgi:hypothetical protein